MKTWVKVVLGIAGAVILLFAAAYFILPPIMMRLESGYQENADQIRIRHTQEIANLVHRFIETKGHAPFAGEVADMKAPAMVLIAHSPEEADKYAACKEFKKGAIMISANSLEIELSKGLGEKIKLPRDPQSVATFGPNIYIYFLAPKQFSVMSHLSEPSDRSVPYKWGEHTYHSHTLVYAKGE